MEIAMLRNIVAAAPWKSVNRWPSIVPASKTMVPMCDRVQSSWPHPHRMARPILNIGCKVLPLSRIPPVMLKHVDSTLRIAHFAARHLAGKRSSSSASTVSGSPVSGRNLGYWRNKGGPNQKKEENQTYRVVAHCYSVLPDAFHFKDAIKALEKASNTKAELFYSEVAHITVPRFSISRKEEQGDVFLFKDGCVVLWAIQPSEQTKPALSNFLPPSTRPASSEFFRWRYGSRFGYHRLEDTLVLTRLEGSSLQRPSTAGQHEGGGGFGSHALDKVVLEKLALSHALQRSVKIDHIEVAMDQLVALTKQVPADIMTGWRSVVENRNALQKLGHVLKMRDIINLERTLETPEAYWNRPELEGLYETVAKELELHGRKDALNTKLDYVYEVVDVWRGY